MASVIEKRMRCHRSLRYRLSRTGSLLALCIASSAVVFSAGSGASTTGATVDGVHVSYNAAAAKLLPKSIKTNGLSIVTSAPYPPFEIFNSNNQLTGLDIFTGEAIAAALGVKSQFTSITFNGIIPALQAGKYDMLLADTGDNAARGKVLNFVEYALQGGVLLVPKGNPDHITGLESMCGKTLAMESGDEVAGFFNPLTSYCKSSGKSPFSLKTLPTTADALLSVKSGSAQAQLVGVATAPSLAKSENMQVVDVPGQTGGYGAVYVGAGMLKSSTELTDAVHAAMTSLVAQGVLKKLFTKYGIEGTLIPKVLDNVVTSGGLKL